MTNASTGKKSVTVSWDNSQTVDYYNIFRTEVSGRLYTLVAPDLPDNYYCWMNSSLTLGVGYFYVMTSVVDGLESGYSNEVSAVPR